MSLDIVLKLTILNNFMNSIRDLQSIQQISSTSSSSSAAAIPDLATPMFGLQMSVKLSKFNQNDDDSDNDSQVLSATISRRIKYTN